ncbi:MAG: nucleotidyltransferase domain-containing protein [Bacteroidota bacterium]
MHPHHAQSIRNVTEFFQRDPDVLALLLAGSIAHGYETSSSDVDILILVSEADHQKRLEENRVHFFNRDLCTYEGGYVDGKYLNPGFLAQVKQRGSEPARFAFSGSQVLFSRMEGLEEEIREVAEYPTGGKEERIRRFYAQFEAWHWYCQESLRLKNQYLLGTSVSKFILFSGRLILAHNELLYPYHKWFLRVLRDAKEKPDGLLESIQQLNATPSIEAVETLYERVKSFRPWVEGDFSWPTQFMFDSELNWMDGKTPVDDL